MAEHHDHDHQFESVYESQGGIPEETANFGQGVALMDFLIQNGYTSQEKAYTITREDYDAKQFNKKILRGAVPDNGEAFQFWVEDVVDQPGVH